MGCICECEPSERRRLGQVSVVLGLISILASVCLILYFTVWTNIILWDTFLVLLGFTSAFLVVLMLEWFGTPRCRAKKETSPLQEVESLLRINNNDDVSGSFSSSSSSTMA